MKRHVWVDRWDDPNLGAPEVETQPQDESTNGAQGVDKGINSLPKPPNVETPTKESIKRQRWVDTYDDSKTKTPDRNGAKQVEAKHQRSIDRPDGLKIAPGASPVYQQETQQKKWVHSFNDPAKTETQHDNSVKQEEAKNQRSVDGQDALNQKYNHAKPKRQVWVDHWNTQEYGTQTDDIVTRMHRDAPGSSIESPVSHQVRPSVNEPFQNAHLGEQIEVSSLSKGPTVGEASTARRPQGALSGNVGVGIPKRADTPIPFHLDQNEDSKTFVTKALQHDGQVQGYSTWNCDPTFQEGTPQRGLQHSRWAQADADRFRTPIKFNPRAQRPVAIETHIKAMGGTPPQQTPSVKVNQSISTKEASGTTPAMDLSTPFIAAAKLPDRQHEHAKEAAQNTLKETDPTSPSPIPEMEMPIPKEESPIPKEESINMDEVNISPDPRGKTPVELWTDQDWNETRRPQMTKPWDTTSMTSDDVLVLPGATKRFLEWWNAKVPRAPSNVLGQLPEGHQHRDIDPSTGNFLDPVEYEDVPRGKSVVSF